MVLYPQCLVSEEDGCIQVAGRDAIDVYYLFGPGFSLERPIIQTDHSFGLEHIFDLVVVIFEPLVIEAFLQKLPLFPRLSEWGQPIGYIG